MEEIDAQRYVLPGLLTLLILGAFLIVVTNGGGEEPAQAIDGAPTRASTTTTKSTTPTTPVPASSGRFVKVRPGDTPTSVADRSAISAERLLDLNPSVDPDSLRAGQNLKLVP